jgi:hypothetical protein
MQSGAPGIWICNAYDGFVMLGNRNPVRLGRQAKRQEFTNLLSHVSI